MPFSRSLALVSALILTLLGESQAQNIHWQKGDSLFEAGGVGIAASDSALFLLADGTPPSIYRRWNDSSQWELLGSSQALFGYNPSAIYAHGRIVIFANDSGYFRTLDYGKTWQHYFNNTQFTRKFGYRNGILYALGGVRQPLASTDSGITWSPVSGSQQRFYQQGDLNSQGIFLNPDINALTSAIFSQRNSGDSTWYVFRDTIAMPDPRSVVCDDSTVYVSTANGIAYSSDTAITWHYVGGEKNLGLLLCFARRIYAQGQFGLMWSEDTGRTWHPSNSGIGTAGGMYSLVARGSTLYCSTQLDAFQSSDSGRTWESLDHYVQGFSVDQIVGFRGSLYIQNGDGLFVSPPDASSFLRQQIRFSPVSLLSRDTELFAASADSIYRTTDGISWHAFEFNRWAARQLLQIDGRLYASTFSKLYALEGSDSIERSTENYDIVGHVDTLLVIGFDGSASRSTDRGATWFPAIKVDAATHLGYSKGITYAVIHGQLMRSSNLGGDWLPTGYPAVAGPILCNDSILVFPISANRFAFSYGAQFFITDSVPKHVTSLTVYDDKLVVSTNPSMWVADVSSFKRQSRVGEQSLSGPQLSWNDGVLSLRSHESTELRIFDLLGHCLARYQLEGNSRISLKDLTPGVYYTVAKFDHTTPKVLRILVTH